MAITAGIIGDLAIAALIAPLDVTAQGGSATGHNIMHHTPLRSWQRGEDYYSEPKTQAARDDTWGLCLCGRCAEKLDGMTAAEGLAYLSRPVCS